MAATGRSRQNAPSELYLLGPDEVLVQVRAAGVNNTDVNMRVGWYSKSVTGGTESAALPDRRLFRRKTPAGRAGEVRSSLPYSDNRNRAIMSSED
jgi:hypothetical protein